MTAFAEVTTASAPAVEPAERGAAVLLDGLHRPLADFAPVLALTLVICQWPDEPEILVGVRSPAANHTHPDVASVPTRRVPLLLAEAWLADVRRDGAEPAAARADLRVEVTNVLAAKLGLADALELGRIRFRVLRLEATQGVSVIGEEDGDPLTENLTMFNACVILEEGRDLVPRATASYDPLVWGTVGNFLAMSASHDAGQLDAGLEAAFVCAYGLCLRTSERMLGSTALDRTNG